MKRRSVQDKQDSEGMELPLLSKGSYVHPPPTKKKTFFTSSLSSEATPDKYITKNTFLQYISFANAWPLTKKANAKEGPLTHEDLPPQFPYFNSERKIIELDNAWAAELEKKDPSIVKAFLKTFKKECMVLQLLVLLLNSTRLYMMPLLGNIIKAITAKSLGEPVEISEVLHIAISMVFVIIFHELLNCLWTWHFGMLNSINMKNTIIGFTYKKLQSVTLSSIQKINVGKVINLLSNDVNEIERAFTYLASTTLCPFLITVCAAILWSFYGYATIFGILIQISCMVLSNYLSKKSQALRGDKSATTDARIKLTNELISSIQLIKMYAWQKAFMNAINVLRESEIRKFIKLRTVEVLGISFATTSTQSSLVVMCILHVLSGGQLSPEKIYTSIMVLSFVSLWGIEFFHQGLMFISTMKVVKGRLETVLFLDDVLFEEDSVKEEESSTGVVFSNFTAWWDQSDQKPCLDNINLTLKPGELTTVIGSIGAGKTSFLLSFLRETPVTQGILSFKGRVAYVEQEPIIFSDTVQSNILFGREYDDHLYKTVVRACCLKDDFKQFKNGDQTLVGEKGITMSGGQKARMSLARALYSQSDIYLLDDPLSAVDSRVGRHIFKYAIKGELLRDKVVVLVTHHLNYAQESDRVLLFSEGKIIGDGKFEELKKLDNSLFNKFQELEIEETTRASSMKKSTTIHEITEAQIADAKLEQENHGKEKSVPVTIQTYVKYFKEMGRRKAIPLFLIYLFSGSTIIGFNSYLGSWGEAHSKFYSKQNTNSDEPVETFNNTPYIFTAILFLITIISFIFTKIILSAKFLLETNSELHIKALKRVTKSQSGFFDKTPSGVILNRFSTDLGTLDSANVTFLPIVMDGFTFIALRMITLMFVSPPLILPMIIIGFVAFKTKRLFEKVVTETKNLDLTSRSPLYSEITATIHGLLAIRVFRQGGRFMKKFCDLLYTNLRAYLYSDRTIKFFGVWMAFFASSLNILGVFVCIYLAFYTTLDAGLFGLALLMLNEIASLTGFLFRMSFLVDINMQSVNRIMDFYTLPSEAANNIPEKDNPLRREENGKKWPTKGEVVFNNVFMKYSPELDYVLKGLSFEITPGSKVGIVGRTGAGKSSIIQALFRMREVENIPGSQIQIDGVNISSIGLKLLRENIAIIPQSPIVFTGTIKRNLDPFNNYSNFELWQALQEVNLKEYVESLENQLETDMSMSSSVFSAGQKQLICLARAILRKSKIIVLDEATANVDIETDDFIQKKIMEMFKDCTVITIAHRLITIANYDKVLVLEAGKVLEYDSPYMLMVKRKGDEAITKEEGVFAQMVKSSGDSMAKKIFEISSQKFYGSS